jgi:hypothetical protein
VTQNHDNARLSLELGCLYLSIQEGCLRDDDRNSGFKEAQLYCPKKARNELIISDSIRTRNRTGG